jgi:hypothetical protein
MVKQSETRMALVQTKVRMLEHLRRQVLAAAKKSGRSFSGEVNHLIETGLAKSEREVLVKSAATEAAEETASRLVMARKLTPEFEALVTRVLRKLSASWPPDEPTTPMPPVDPLDDWWRRKDETS